ncbi:hypothetical protein HPG69_002746 [Diceros bicornis minor]|uniref:Uncharacterized protein n=1 Tax=Diceros bicornis minor TaxID=77932 RepID=A0A7J7FLM7_DICBM|nr:hypothetical protein HPG69_002746 [Diceros bicornis minor]
MASRDHLGGWLLSCTCASQSHSHSALLFERGGPLLFHPEGTDKCIALVYALLTPFLNPIIYTLRNKEVKEAVKRVTMQFLEKH